MNPFQLLGNEHHLIAQVVDAFEVFINRVDHDEPSVRRDLEDFMVWFREFEDLGHHDKEEMILFPAMVRHGFRWDDGPVQVIRREHDQERYLARTLRYAALQRAEWTQDGQRQFLGIARDFIAFLRAHMKMENEVLFPDAERTLPEEAKAQIAKEILQFDELRTRDGELAAMSAIATRLRGVYRGAAQGT